MQSRYKENMQYDELLEKAATCRFLRKNPMRRFLLWICFFCAQSLAFANSILVEAEAFQQTGGWMVDQQFMDIMGSPYLIAHGMGVPVADATTVVRIAKKGRYQVYARTFNWTSCWNSKEGPGAFRISVGGTELPHVLGTKGSAWEWQYAGSIDLGKGETTLTLKDMSGFDGRCDAVYLTTQQNPVLPCSMEELDQFRRELGTLPKSPSDGGQYDLVVVGAGIGGICTAISASRLGLKVALVHDRPILGGNNSSEVRVHLGGKTEMEPYPALGRLLREFGHSKIGNAQSAENYEDGKKDSIIAAEPNITLLRNYRAVKAEMNANGGIASVVIRQTRTGAELRLSAPLFCDCTGDGNLGFMAGADWRMGREGQDEFGESLAPELPDKMTMGASVQWYSIETDGPKDFPEFNYGPQAFTDESCQKVTMGEWTWETGMNYNQITDFERIRDYGMLVIYANWSYLKNHLRTNEKYRNRQLGWVAYVAGKRESRRLMGDYILKQDDVDKHVFHEDATFTMNWHFDLHFPDPENSRHFPGNEFKAETKSNPIYPYAVPYRCLYSRNVNNLFMAGRCISVTHVTLGSTRLMRTIAMMGEVVGMAASVCKAHQVLPRQVYQHYLTELKELMKQGVGRTDKLPDNQNFNVGGYLKEKPKVSIPGR